MKDVFKLYINNKLIDFETDPKFEFRYQQEDFSNPTIIKNNFSKSIKIEGTDNNNQIFGEIYQLDRKQLYKFQEQSGVYFDPSKRTPFELYKNGELLESGYMQLTDISITNHKILYNITLYGGLGDFFYSLMYNADGEKRTLGDLYYKIKDENGNLLPRDTELDFKINKEFVEKSWTNLKNGQTGDTINDFIQFAPSYNGLYENFSNNTYLVNAFNSQLFTINNVTVDEVNYGMYDGYLLAKTENDFTEWETRDLRSYMQRPCLKFSRLFDALCDEENNGGYSVNLDTTFFNKNNPYFENAYMAFPLLPTIAEETIEEKQYQLYLDTDYYNNTAHIGYKNNVLMLQTSYRLAFDGDDISATSNNNFKIDMSNVPITSTFDVKLDFDLNFVAETLNNAMNNDELYLSYFRKNTVWDNLFDQIIRTEHLPVYKSIIVQAYMYDTENFSAPQYYSNVLNFTSPVTYEGTTYTSTYEKWINYTDTSKDKYTYTNVFGKFKRQGNTNNYKWVTDEGVSNFYLNIKDIPRKNNMAIALSIKLVYSEYSYNVTPLLVINKQIFESVNGYTDKNLNEVFSYIPYCVKGYSNLPLYNTSVVTLLTNTPTVRSGTHIKKKQLLKTEFSPCDVLLDYCKLFGLYFTKDIHSKTINIMTKNSFFSGNIIDINKRIDHTKGMSIKPFLFETKYYLMKNDANDSYYSKKYENEYNLIYGQKRIDTQYNFNKETKEVYEGSVFQNAISVTDSSPYFRTFFNAFYDICPAFMNETVTVQYFNVSGESVNNTEKQYGKNHWINPNLTVDWNVKSGYDMFPKTCYYTLDNNSKSLNDITSTLLFFNGFEETKDIEGNIVPFWVSDDVVQMVELNDEMCYLYTEYESDLSGKRIAIKYTELPQFLRYDINGGSVTESFDFGRPKEMYIPNVTYNDDATLYNKFWKNYLSDRYDVNTRKVSCYVNLEGMKITQDTMRDFYFFNNCLWVINKIESYLPNSYETTKVEFVKVNDTNNYLNAQYPYQYNGIKLSQDEALVEWNTKNYTIELTSGYEWTATTENNSQEVTPSEGSEGTYTIELDAATNETEDVVENVYTFTSAQGQVVTFNLKQAPSPSNAKLVYGYVYDNKTQRGVADCKVVFGSLVTPFEIRPIIKLVFTATTNAEGYYEVYVGKAFKNSGDVYVYNSNDEEIYSTLLDWDTMDAKNRLDFEV